MGLLILWAFICKARPSHQSPPVSPHHMVGGGRVFKCPYSCVVRLTAARGLKEIGGKADLVGHVTSPKIIKTLETMCRFCRPVKKDFIETLKRPEAQLFPRGRRMEAKMAAAGTDQSQFLTTVEKGDARVRTHLPCLMLKEGGGEPRVSGQQT